MGSSFPMEKLDRNNYASWSYKMHQYLLGHQYWSNVEGANNAAPDTTHMDFSAQEQVASRVMYCFGSNIDDQLLNYIRDAKMPKDAQTNLKKVFVASTTARKLQLQQELNNVRQKDLSVGDYTTRIKEIYDSLASINVIVGVGGEAQNGLTPLPTGVTIVRALEIKAKWKDTKLEGKNLYLLCAP